MKSKIIAFKPITSEDVDASYRVLFRALSNILKNVEKSIERLDPILHSHNENEKTAIGLILNEINYIHRLIELSSSNLVDFEISLGEKFTSAYKNSEERTIKAIENKRRIYLEQFRPIEEEMIELSSILTTVLNNNLYDDAHSSLNLHTSSADFLTLYNEINIKIDSIKDLLAILRSDLRI